MGAGTASSTRATSWSMLVLLKAGWMMTLWIGMIRAPSPDRSTDPRLTAQLVGLGSLSNNKENSTDSEFMEMFPVIFQGHTS